MPKDTIDTTANKNTLHPELWTKLYRPKMLSYTYSCVGDILTAEDIVQDVFEAALCGSSGYKGKANEKTWLYSILRRHIVDFYRRKSRKSIFCFSELTPKSSKQSIDDLLNDLSLDICAHSADEGIIRSQTLTLLENAISSLPKKQALVFRMKVLRRIEAEQICQMLRITPENYWVLMHRARINLKEYIKIRGFF